MSANVDLNQRPDYDRVLQTLADYVLTYRVESPEALDTARNCLMDTLGCGLLALRFPECTKHLGPLVEGEGNLLAIYDSPLRARLLSLKLTPRHSTQRRFDEGEDLRIHVLGRHRIRGEVAVAIDAAYECR